MIKYILMIVCLSFAFWNHADDECADCVTDENEHIKVNDKEIQDLANSICNGLILYNDTGAGRSWEAFQGLILSHLNLTINTADYRSKVTAFWNEHIDYMICTDKHIGYTTPQHLLKRVIEMNVIQGFYFEYLLRDPNAKVNSIQYVDGRAETVIDYLDKLLNNNEFQGLFSIDELRSLRIFLIQIMGAKTGKELLEEKGKSND